MEFKISLAAETREGTFRVLVYPTGKTCDTRTTSGSIRYMKYEYGRSDCGPSRLSHLYNYYMMEDIAPTCDYFDNEFAHVDDRLMPIEYRIRRNKFEKLLFGFVYPAISVGC